MLTLLLRNLLAFWRKHWFAVGGGLALVLSGWLYLHRPELSLVQLLQGSSFVTLLLHQVEEYRWPGYFSGMLNVAVYQSPTPACYPLNSTTAFLVNVPLGWLAYALAALLARLVQPAEVPL